MVIVPSNIRTMAFAPSYSTGLARANPVTPVVTSRATRAPASVARAATGNGISIAFGLGGHHAYWHGEWPIDLTARGDVGRNPSARIGCGALSLFGHDTLSIAGVYSLGVFSGTTGGAKIQCSGRCQKLRGPVVAAASSGAAPAGVPVKIQLTQHVKFGETLKLSGGAPELGEWDLARAPGRWTAAMGWVPRG